MSDLFEDREWIDDQNNGIDGQQPQFQTQLEYNNCPKSHVPFFQQPLALFVHWPSASTDNSTMPNPPPIFATYHTVKQAMALFGLTHAKAEQLIVKNDAVKKHGGDEPLDDADSKDKQEWVEKGFKLIVSDSSTM